MGRVRLAPQSARLCTGIQPSLAACRVRPRDPKCCLTLRSTGPATADQLGPVGGTQYIFANRAKPPCRSGPVTSNVRPQNERPAALGVENRLGTSPSSSPLCSMASVLQTSLWVTSGSKGPSDDRPAGRRGLQVLAMTGVSSRRVLLVRGNTRPWRSLGSLFRPR